MFFVRALVGAAVTAAVAAVTGTLGALILSIVCTAGLSLALWIPLWAAVGRLVEEVAGRFGLRRDEMSGVTRRDHWRDEVPEDAREPVGGIETVRARQYIRFSRREGRSDTEIRGNLLRARWTPAEVDALLALESGGRAGQA